MYKVIIDNEAPISGMPYHHTCRICGRAFVSNSVRSTLCNCCHLEYQCDDCKNWFILNPKLLKRHINSVKHRCDKCNRKFLANKMTQKNLNRKVCTICKKLVNQTDITGVGKDCGCYDKMVKARNQKQHQNNQTPGNCSKCHMFNSKRDIHGYGFDCGCHFLIDNKSRESVKIRIGPGYCCKCGKFNQRRNTTTIGIDCGCFQKHLEDIQSYLHINSSYYEYNQYNEIIKIDGKDFDVYAGIQRCKIDNFDEEVINVKTEMAQDAQDWSKCRKPFEQRISKLGEYIVVLKADVNGNIIQVSMTHTIACNDFAGYSDIKFRKYNPDGSTFGAIGQYLHKKGLDYDKTQVWIIPCNTRQQALLLEKQIHDKYNLFY